MIWCARIRGKQEFHRQEFQNQKPQKETGIEGSNFRKDNRGASLLIVLALFVVLLVVVMNLLMLVSAGDEAAKEEYHTAQTEMYLYSVYDILNTQMVSGAWQNAFVDGETVSIEVEGFEDEEGNEMPVTIEIVCNRNKADVSYHISYQGVTYLIAAQYTYYEMVNQVSIELKACRGMIQL